MISTQTTVKLYFKYSSLNRRIRLANSWPKEDCEFKRQEFTEILESVSMGVSCSLSMKFWQKVCEKLIFVQNRQNCVDSFDEMVLKQL